MEIKRLSFPEYLNMEGGVEIPLRSISNTIPFAVEAVAGYANGLRTLDPGEYDITPKLWKTNASAHNLIVQADGTALYRILPKYSDVININIQRGSQRVRPGGRVIRIPQDQIMIVLAGGGTKVYPGVRLFEIIFHH